MTFFFLAVLFLAGGSSETSAAGAKKNKKILKVLIVLSADSVGDGMGFSILLVFYKACVGPSNVCIIVIC